MIKRKKKEGFTLIELLVIITVVSLIMVVSIVFVNKVMETSKAKSLEITKSNILKSASQYTKEFKLENTDYWFDEQIEVEEEIVEIEYACTTVGMLINKGFLKSNVLGLELLDGTIIDKTTSVKVSRDKNTKVFTDETIFNDSACSETGDINLMFSVEGDSNLGYENWYKNDVTIKISGSNMEQLKEIGYIIQTTDNTQETINPVVQEEKSEDWQIIVDKQGEGIKVCVTGYDTKDQPREFCLADNQKYNMDKVDPKNLAITFSDGSIVAKSATDNVTANSDIKYVLDDEINDTTNTTNNYIDYISGSGSVSSNIKKTDNISNLTITATATDKAGNSVELTKNLAITDPQEGTTSSKYIYWCDIWGGWYDTKSEAANECYYWYDGPAEMYTCSLTKADGWIYYSQEDATNDCNWWTEDWSTYTCSLTKDYGWTYGSKEDATNDCNQWTEDWSTYTCSLTEDYGWTYPTKEDAEYDCAQAGGIEETYYYTCSLNSNKYDTWEEAYNDCYESDTGTVSTAYFCDGEESSSSTCTKYSYGSGRIEYVCTGSPLTWQAEDEDYTDIGCDDGYTKKSYTCEPWGGVSLPDGETCSSFGDTTVGFVDCTNTCTASAERRYICETTGYDYDTRSEAVADCSEGYIYGDVYENIGYYCSANGKTYTSYSAAQSYCSSAGTVSKTSEYYCSWTGETYTTQTKATNACTGSVSKATSEYYCSWTDTTYSTQAKATSACTGTVSGGSNRYYCEYTNSIYSSLSSAKSACAVSPRSQYAYFCSLDSYYPYETSADAKSACASTCLGYTSYEGKCYGLS